MKREPGLFAPIAFRDATARNRVMVSPMSQYRARDGFVSDWHFAHVAKFAMAGAGFVFMESTKVERRGRSSVGDAGIWKDDHVPALRRIAEFVRAQGAIAGIQLGHAGRKAGVQRPWEGFGPLDRQRPIDGDEHWEVVGPSAVAAFDGWPVPRALTLSDIQDVIGAWGMAAKRALAAGFDALEIHGAHGYLIHQFLSPEANRRTDAYGGTLARRMRFAAEVVESVREHWPASKPLFFRVSAVDESGWTLEDSSALADVLKGRGIDAFDCSSGGIGIRSPTAAPIARHLGYQVPYAERIRRNCGIATIAVGLIVDPRQADDIVRSGKADLVALAREFIADPNWVYHAARALGSDPNAWLPIEYGWWLDRRERSGSIA